MNQRQALTTMVVGLCALFIGYLLYNFVPNLISPPTAIESLEGEWEACLPHERDTKACQWVPVTLPVPRLPVELRDEFSDWVAFKKNIIFPEQCRNYICSIVIGEVGDSAEIYINGALVGKNGQAAPKPLYWKHYPVNVDIPPSLLGKAGGDEVKILVYSMKRVQFGIRKAPFGIFDHRDAFLVSQSQVIANVLTPLFSFVWLSIVGLVILLGVIIHRIADVTVHSFVRYCLVASVFCLSFSELPREYLPISVAGYIHFFFRALSDWAYLEMGYAFFGGSNKAKRVFRALYLTTLIAFVAAPTYHYFNGRLGDSRLGFETAFLIMRLAAPLVIAPHVISFLGVLRIKGSPVSKTVGIVLFLLLLLAQIYDTAIFHGFITGTYLVKMYVIFVMAYFGAILVKRYQIETAEVLAEKKIARIASQMAHDVRSPLGALNMIADRLPGVPESTVSLLKSAINRINDITNDLSTKTTPVRSTSESIDLAEPQIQLIDLVVHELVREKKYEYGSRKEVEFHLIPTKDLGCFAKIDVTEFKRVLSNVINNAVESIVQSGKIEVSLVSVDKQIEIRINDTGKGIPKKVIPKLFERGMTYEKPNGSGLGLYHAKRSLQKWRGTIAIDSEEGKGTSVLVSLPIAKRPDWYVSAIDTSNFAKVIVIDDDISVFGVWKERISHVPIECFQTTRAFEDWFNAASVKEKNALYLVDQEFRSEAMTGLRLIQKYNLAHRSILVTSSYSDPNVIYECEKRGIKLLPKPLMSTIPVK